jgi:hypothetical protein
MEIGSKNRQRKAGCHLKLIYLEKAMYVSITGLKPKGLWGLIKFWTLAVPTFREAQVVKRNRQCAVKRIRGYQCTVTALENRDLMLNL